eukprot:scaffold183584_cov28-Tisochrysis_lutea.AAC.6
MRPLPNDRSGLSIESTSERRRCWPSAWPRPPACRNTLAEEVVEHFAARSCDGRACKCAGPESTHVFPSGGGFRCAGPTSTCIIRANTETTESGSGAVKAAASCVARGANRSMKDEAHA